MKPTVRKLGLTVHIACSVGLLGSIAAFLALALAGVTGEDSQIVRAAYSAMDIVARRTIVPLALAALATGLVQALGTPWGLLRHYWVLAKFLITAFAVGVLLAKMELIAYGAQLAGQPVVPRADLHAVGIELAVHAAGGLLVLLVPTVLSVFKPWGVTPYGRRVRQSVGMVSPRVSAAARPALSGGSDKDDRISGGAITIRLRRAHLLATLVIVAGLHLVVLHIAGIGIAGH